MHADESRDPAVLERQLLQDFTADPAVLRTRYQGLQARDVAARKRIAELEKELARLRKVEAENRDLKRRLGSAHGALDAYRAESARLKADLKRLRASQAYRIGRTLARPAALLRRPARPATPAPVAAIEAPPLQAAVEPEPSVTDPSVGEVPDTASPPPSVPRRLSEYTFDELVERFHEQPGPERLGHVLSRAWYQQGLITVPARLLREHPDHAEALDHRSKDLAARILGGDRVITQGLDIPPRASGPAYRPERDRVMYCAYSTPAFNSNGYSLRTKGVAEGLRSAGADVVVVARAGYPWDAKIDGTRPTSRRHVARVDGIDYVHLPGANLGTSPVDHYVLQCADAFVREARLTRPSLIHAASNHRVGLAALIAARRLGLPFVYEVRGLWEITEASDKPGWEDTERFAEQVGLETLVATEADVVLAITTQTRDELLRRGVDPERIRLAPNAVDPAEFVPLPKDVAYAARRKVRTDVPVIGFAGSMVPYEGLATLVDAAAILRDRGIGFQVGLAGSGSAEPELKARVAELGLDAHVRFLGRVPAEEMPRVLSLFDIMPCPRLSLPVTEMVSPLKPLEALSSSKAVVLSDVAPHIDIAGPDEERALLFPAGDAEALADVLARLIEDPRLRADLGRAGRLWCVDERNWSTLGAAMREAHAAAASEHDALVDPARTRAPSDLRVGLIADEFTTSTLSESVQVVPLDREGWPAQLEQGLDLVFIESAWEGNGGQWHRGVGYYSPEEDRAMAGLLAAARQRGIPTVFWNKEDPVHYARFVATASRCDHVFTTDGNMVVRYLQAGVGRLRTASSLPFYAQPRIHNPLPGRRPFERTIAYAGTYYGDRYAQRSAELAKLLGAARPHGLAIYDRQAAIPDSPYHFPPAFQRDVRGSLPYGEVIDSYKSHLANLNVNSVADSPSMFSRRVVEVAACGGVVLSGPGRGIEETFGTAIPSTGDALVWRALLRDWAVDPQSRLREAWLQMRAVLRSHTVGTALTILARTAGIPVTGPQMPSYAVVLDGSRPDLLAAVAAQSVLPRRVWVTDGLEAASQALTPLGVAVSQWTGSVPRGNGGGDGGDGGDGDGSAAADFVGRLTSPVSRTHFEDLLLATLFGSWERIAPVSDPQLEHGRPMASPVERVDSVDGLVAADVLARTGDLDAALRSDDVRGVELLVPWEPAPVSGQAVARAAALTASIRAGGVAGRTVVVAGHDLKFARFAIEALETAGAEVLLDEWQTHTQHDEERSQQLLERADIVLCEWALGNAVWYSKRVQPDQRLVVRVHSQELRRPQLAQIRHEAVDAYVFVGDLIREAAIHSHGVPREKCHVVPNAVDVGALDLPKHDGAQWALGLVGIVPQSKRLDLALDVLERLLERDGRYRLRIKGKIPEDYPWMLDRPDEMAYYEAQYARIEGLNASFPDAVVFDGHGDDMPEWYAGIGVALSVSDFESFHLTIADGAATGALPALLAWPGSDLVYPREWISPTVDALADRVATVERDPAAYQRVARERFALPAVTDSLLRLLSGAPMSSAVLP
ncbi:MAG TPA: glycosyltransferase [Intrasporangium sp.]|uniref:glycosyltransferase n=1 Tax=Intrasporangium sp. TaxID=1925024 RepID=UPI002D76DCBD|nr:glycosyltransferase [Intrasporangium sp.]HET7397100.1 glycosyltransferase [Intrasporangium sp.]